MKFFWTIDKKERNLCNGNFLYFRTIICKKLLRLRKDIHRVTLVYLSFLCVNFYISIFPLTDRQAPRECGQHAGVGQSELCQSRPGIVTGYPNGRIRPPWYVYQIPGQYVNLPDIRPARYDYRISGRPVTIIRYPASLFSIDLTLHNFKLAFQWSYPSLFNSIYINFIAPPPNKL